MIRPDSHVIKQVIKCEQGRQPTENNGPNQQKHSWLYCRQIGCGMNACLHRNS